MAVGDADNLTYLLPVARPENHRDLLRRPECRCLCRRELAALPYDEFRAEDLGPFL
jgi:hypothetical protein